MTPFEVKKLGFCDVFDGVKVQGENNAFPYHDFQINKASHEAAERLAIAVHER